MNKSILFVIVSAFFAVTTAAPLSAQMAEDTHEHQGEEMGDQDGGRMSGMMGGGMMGGKKGGMMHMCPMMGAMTAQSVSVADDGSAVVLAGNKLLKYDSDLNLVKEQTIQMDFSGMQGTMQQMMEQCPMCRKMMKDMEKDKKSENG